MDTEIRDTFISLWQQYFEGEPLPITFEITEDTRGVPKAKIPSGWHCLVCDLTRVKNGTDIAFHPEAVTCKGGLRYTGYETERPPGFSYFLSYGKEGVIEGERYKQSPEVVDAWQNNLALLPTSGKNFLFKRWDHLNRDDNPEVVIFYARPEVLSGLFTLVNFDRADPFGVITPMGAGCSSIIHYPWLEQQSDDPRAVLGMFDPSARPCVPVDVLTLAIPMKKFIRMIPEMKESFLITGAWEKVRKKMEQSRKQ